MRKQVLSSVALLLVLTTSIAQAQISRAATAASYIERGNARNAEGELKEVLGDYDFALNLDPRHATAYFNRGPARWDNGELDRAIADYTKDIGLNPRLADAYSNRCAALYLKGGHSISRD